MSDSTEDLGRKQFSSGDMASRLRNRISKGSDESLDSTTRMVHLGDAKASEEDGVPKVRPLGETQDLSSVRDFVSISVDDIYRKDKAERDAIRAEQEAIRAEQEAAEKAARDAEEAEKARLAEEAASNVESDSGNISSDEVSDSNISSETMSEETSNDTGNSMADDSSDDLREVDESGLTIIDGEDVGLGGVSAEDKDKDDKKSDKDDSSNDDGNDNDDNDDKDDENAEENGLSKRAKIMIAVCAVLAVIFIGVCVWVFGFKGKLPSGNVSPTSSVASGPTVSVSDVFFSNDTLTVTFKPSNCESVIVTVVPVNASGNAIRTSSGSSGGSQTSWSSGESDTIDVSFHMTEDEFSQMDSLSVEVQGANFDDSNLETAINNVKRGFALNSRQSEITDAENRREEIRKERAEAELREAEAKKKAEEEAAKKKAEEEAAKKQAEEEARRRAQTTSSGSNSSSSSNSSSNNNNNNSNSNNNTNTSTNTSTNSTPQVSDADRAAINEVNSATSSMTGVNNGAYIDTGSMTAALLSRNGNGAWTVTRRADLYQDCGVTGVYTVRARGFGEDGAACADGSYRYFVSFEDSFVDDFVTIGGHETMTRDGLHWRPFGIAEGRDMRSGTFAHSSDGVYCLPGDAARAFFEGLPVGSVVVIR